MPGIVLSGDQSAVVLFDAAPIIEMKQNWGDPWTIFGEVEFRGAVQASAAHDLSSINLSRRYGRVQSPHEYGQATPGTNKAIPDRGPKSFDDWWVRLRLVTPQNQSSIEFVGTIQTEPREVHNRELMNAAGTATIASGVQQYTAYGPLQILRKLHVNESTWLVEIPDPGDPEELVEREKTLEWVPVMNGRDRRNMLVGNRSLTRGLDDMHATSDERPYLFGGSSLWSHFDFLEYILLEHIQEYDELGEKTGPIWTLGGQTDLLENIFTTQRFSAEATVDQILRALISPDFGVEWCIRITAEGFEIFVYALLGETIGYSGKTLPKNPNLLIYPIAGSPHHFSVEVEKQRTHMFDKIVIQGKRIVCCCSLEAFTEDELDADETLKASLVPKWPAEFETAYNAATDAVRRKTSQWEPVYQMFGAPVDWDHLKGKACGAVISEVDGETTVDRIVYPEATGEQSVEEVAKYQNRVRATLTWTPLRAGVDYSPETPVDSNESGVEPEFLPPAVYLYDTEDEESAKYKLAEIGQVHVSVLREDWGVFLSATPNHLLAYGRFDPEAPSTEASETSPRFEMARMKATIALETDRRLKLEYHVVSPLDQPIRSVKVINDNDAEAWYVAPNTIVKCDNGTLKRIPQTEGLVLRNDADRLALQMAGAIARYGRPRQLVRIRMKGLIPSSDFIGKILSAVDDGGDLQQVKSPITAVSYEVTGEGTYTTIVAGFADT